VFEEIVKEIVNMLVINCFVDSERINRKIENYNNWNILYHLIE